MSLSSISNRPTEETQRWAILIGVNFYKDPINRLSGCVRDVTNIEACLETIPGPLNIFTFTASTPSGPDASYPSEPKTMWPTYSNITSTIEHILQSGRKNDFVYIHFSGHGRHLCAEKERDDFALVLVEDDEGRNEIEGLDLTKRLKKMVERGINVTLVLDCCFSGSIPRQAGESGTATRTIRPRQLDHVIPLGLEIQQLESLVMRSLCPSGFWNRMDTGYWPRAALTRLPKSLIITECGMVRSAYSCVKLFMHCGKLEWRYLIRNCISKSAFNSTVFTPNNTRCFMGIQGTCSLVVQKSHALPAI